LGPIIVGLLILPLGYLGAFSLLALALLLWSGLFVFQSRKAS